MLTVNHILLLWLPSVTDPSIWDALYDLVLRAVGVFTGFFTLAALFGRIVEGSLWFSANSAEAVEDLIDASYLGLVLPFVAGVSLTFGRGIDLFVNRVSRVRFFLILLVGGLLAVAGAIIWALSIVLLADFVYHDPADLDHVMWAVCMGYAPLLFAYIAVMPYLGPIIERVLEVWHLAAIVAAITVVAQIDVWEALGCVLPGWLIAQVLQHNVLSPVVRVRSLFWRITTGKVQRLDVHQLALTLQQQAAQVVAAQRVLGE